MTRRGDQRGAALVEAAIILPVVLLVMFGAIEFGLGFSDAAALRSASRSGARSGSALPRDPRELQAIVDAVNASLGSVAHATPGTLLMWKATGAGATSPPSTCSDGNGCTSTAWDAATKRFADVPIGGSAPTWPLHTDACPTEAENIGVQIRADYGFITGLFGTSIGLDETTIIRLEPTAAQACKD